MKSFQQITAHESAPCIHPWTDIWVNAAGNVTCCPQNRRLWGNLNNSDYAALRNSEEAQAVRHHVARGEYRQAGCDPECPFLRGSYEAPRVTPPTDELINPEFALVEDETPYAGNLQTAIREYRTAATRLTANPLFVDLQPVLRCNADCFMCGQPHDSPLVHAPLLVERLEPLKATANWFRWQGGEVFMERSFKPYLDDFDDPRYPHLRRYVITNATLLTPEWIERYTAGPRPVFFLVSIDGVSETTYSRVRQKLDHGRALLALQDLAQAQRRQNRRDLVRWNYVVMRSTLDEVEAAIHQAELMEVDLNLAPIQGDYPDENFFNYPGDDYRKLYDTLARLQRLADCSDISVTGFDGMFTRLKQARGR